MQRTEPPTITLTGPHIASLLEHIPTRTSDLEGFIYGTRLTRHTRTLDDASDAHVTVTARTLVVQHLFITTHTDYQRFYHAHDGSVDAHLLPREPPFASSSSSSSGGKLELLGFFKVRSEAPLRPSLREKAVMKSMASVLYDSDAHEDDGAAAAAAAAASSSEPLVFALFSSKELHTGHPLEVNYKFFSLWEGDAESGQKPGNSGHAVWKSVPFTLVNMTAGSASEYAAFDAFSAVQGQLGEQEHPPQFVRQMEQAASDVLQLIKAETREAVELAREMAEAKAEYERALAASRAE